LKTTPNSIEFYGERERYRCRRQRLGLEHLLSNQLSLPITKLHFSFVHQFLKGSFMTAAKSMQLYGEGERYRCSRQRLDLEHLASNHQKLTKFSCSVS